MVFVCVYIEIVNSIIELLESKISSTDLIMNDRRTSMKPSLFEDIALVKFNK